MHTLQQIAILLALAINVDASADSGWVGQFNNLQCSGPAIFEPADDTNTVWTLNAGGCVTFKPILDTIGIYWCSAGQEFGSGYIDHSFRQLFIFKDEKLWNGDLNVGSYGGWNSC